MCRTRSGFKTKKEALECLPALRDDMENVKDIKFSKLYDEWSAIHYKNIGKSKQTAYRIAYNKCEAIHYRNVADIRAKDLQNIVDSCSSGYYPKHDIKVLCNMIFKFAMQNDYIIKNYASFIKLPPIPKSKRDAFKPDEIAAIWESYNNGHVFAGYILILVYTGMRLGELQKIQKEAIFLDQGYMIGGIKTEAGINREIIIHDRIKPIVQLFLSERKKKLLEMSEENFYINYYETLKLAGVRRLTPHCCRHTFMTLMAKADVQPAVIQAAGGHADYQTTLQYTHIPLEKKIEAVNKI